MNFGKDFLLVQFPYMLVRLIVSAIHIFNFLNCFVYLLVKFVRSQLGITFSFYFSQYVLFLFSVIHVYFLFVLCG